MVMSEVFICGDTRMLGRVLLPGRWQGRYLYTGGILYPGYFVVVLGKNIVIRVSYGLYASYHRISSPHVPQKKKLVCRDVMIEPKMS